MPISQCYISNTLFTAMQLHTRYQIYSKSFLHRSQLPSFQWKPSFKIFKGAPAPGIKLHLHFLHYCLLPHFIWFPIWELEQKLREWDLKQIKFQQFSSSQTLTPFSLQIASPSARLLFNLRIRATFPPTPPACLLNIHPPTSLAATEAPKNPFQYCCNVCCASTD